MNCLKFLTFVGLLCIYFGCITAAPVSENFHSINEVSCGIVYDGLTNGRYDLQQQSSTTTISANWIGFGSSILFYEWAIISDSKQFPRSESRCYDYFQSHPDVQRWTSVKKSSSAINNHLNLSIGRTYYVLVRANFKSGHQIISISDGVQIVPKETLSSNEEQTKKRLDISSSTTKDHETETVCRINTENECRSGSIAVRELLQELYGRPRFEPENQSESIFTFFPLVPVVEEGDDDDDLDGKAWIIAPIVGGVLLLLCLLLLLLLLAALLFRVSLPEREASAPKQAPVAFGENEREKKGYGMRGEVGMGNIDSETRVEFPDTQVRRLSISHDKPADAPAAEAHSPRRKHPIMSSTSSSFRDYHSVN